MNKFFYHVSITTVFLLTSFSISANNLAWLSSVTYYVNQANEVNSPPILVDDSFNTNEDESGNFDVLANDSDPDGDTLEILSASAETGSVVINTDYSITYIPVDNYYGQDSINYTVTDRNGGIASATAIIEVNAVNDGVPVVANESVTSVVGNSINNFDVLSNDTDIDLDVLIVSAAQALNGTVVINADNTITYTAFDGFIGSDEIQYTVSDGNGGSTIGIVSVTVYPINSEAPKVLGQSLLEVQEEASLALSLSHFTIVDSDSAFSDLSLLVGSGSNYTVSGNIITPANNFNGEITVPITISDGEFVSESYLASIKVLNVNDAPVVFSTTLTLDQDTSTPPLHFYSGFQYDADIGSNTDDPRLEQFQYLFSLTATTTDSGGRTHHGQITQVPGQKHGTFIYTPDPGFSGRDYAFYFVYDDTGRRSGRGDLVFDVAQIQNQPPVITDHTDITIDEEGSYSFTLDDFSITDPDDSIFTLTILDGNQYSVVENSNTIVLKENVDGVVTILVTVSDGENTSAVYSASINVTPINDTPRVFDWQETLYKDGVATAIHFRTGMLYDPEASKNPTLLDSFTYQFVDNVNSTNGKTAHGQMSQVTGQAKGVFIYTPDPGFTGVDTVAFWVTDEQGAQSEQGTMTYHVLGKEPNIIGQTSLSILEEGMIHLLLANFTIKDDDSSSFTLTVHDGENYTHDGNIVTPSSNFFGELKVLITVSDGAYTSPEFEAIVSVTPEQDAPIITGTPAITVNVGSNYSFTPTATDADNETLTFSITGKPVWASFEPTTGALTGTLQAVDIGFDTGIIISVSDGTDSVSLPSFDIEVSAGSDLTVSFVSPLTGSQLAVGEVIVTVSPSDDSQTQEVLFSSDGSTWFSDPDGMSPWQYDFSALLSGNYTIYTKAVDLSSLESPVNTINIELVLAVPEIIIDYTAATASYVVSWNTIASATTYELEESIDQGEWQSLGSLTATNKAFTEQPYGDYNYRVKACDSLGSCSLLSVEKNVNVAIVTGQCPAQ